MSKSLKNFIKIKNLVKEYGYKEIRLLFLLHKYDEVMDFHEKSKDEIDTSTQKKTSSMTEPVEKVKRFKEFFQNVKAVLRQNPIEKDQRWTKIDTVRKPVTQVWIFSYFLHHI